MRASPPDTICVVRVSAIGDTCHALAVVRRLQDNWPQAKITWVIGKTEASLLGHVDGVEFIIFDKRAGFTGYRRTLGAIGERRFDVVLCLHASLRVNLLYPFIRSPLKIGFDRRRARDLQWLVTHRRAGSSNGKHAMDAMLAFADAIGAEPTALRWDIPLSDEATRFAQDFAESGRPLVVVSPCSSERARNFRNWPIERFETLCRHLVEERGCRVVLTGGGSAVEHAYGEAIARAAAVDNFIGRTSLTQLLALIDAAAFIVCPDSGPAHMATTVATPVIGLYASSNPRRTGPYRSLDLVVDRYPDAAEQFLGKPVDALSWGQRIRDPDVMKLITIDDVLEKIDEIMRRLSP